MNNINGKFSGLATERLHNGQIAQISEADEDEIEEIHVEEIHVPSLCDVVSDRLPIARKRDGPNGSWLVKRNFLPLNSNDKICIARVLEKYPEILHRRVAKAATKRLQRSVSVYQVQRINANKESILQTSNGAVQSDDLLRDVEDEMEHEKLAQSSQVVVFDTRDDAKCTRVRPNIQDKLFIAKYLEEHPNATANQTAQACSLSLGKEIKKNIVARVKTHKESILLSEGKSWSKIKSGVELEFEREFVSKIEGIPLLSYKIAKEVAQTLRREEKYQNTIWTKRTFSTHWWRTFCRNYGFKYIQRRGKMGSDTGGWVRC